MEAAGAGDENRTHDIQLGKLHVLYDRQDDSCKTDPNPLFAFQWVTSEKQNRIGPAPDPENKTAAPTGIGGGGETGHHSGGIFFSDTTIAPLSTTIEGGAT